jgi:hypothetical protein
LPIDVADADVADRVRVRGHGLNDAAGRTLKERALRDAGLAHDELLPALERAGRRVAPDHDDGLVVAPHFLPALDLAGVDVAELFLREFRNRVRLVDHGDDRVVGDREAHGLHAVRFEVLGFLRLHVAGGHRDVGHLVAKGLDAVARPRARDRDRHVLVGGHEGFRHLLHRGEHRRGAVHGHRAGPARTHHRKARNGAHRHQLRVHFFSHSIHFNNCRGIRPAA